MIVKDSLAVFALMKSRMQMLGLRQKTLAGNIANISTPRYVPRDVDMQAFSKAMRGTGTGMVSTNARHMHSSLPMQPVIRDAPDSETTLDGNQVVAEEQMSKIAETRMEFETMIELYRKSLGMLRMAAKDPLN